jgi:hypothetical protein
MEDYSWLIYGLLLVAFWYCLRLLFASRAQPSKADDGCSGKLPSSKKGTLGTHKNTWQEGEPFYVEVDFTADSDADVNLSKAVLCYSDIEGGGKATWHQDVEKTHLVPHKNTICYAFTPVKPAGPEGRVLGTGKGTIVVTQGVTRYLVDGEMALKCQLRRALHQLGTLWPPFLPAAASNTIVSTTKTTDAGAIPATWKADATYTVAFASKSPNFNNPVSTALLVNSDNVTETSYWPLVSSTVSSPDMGVTFNVTLVFRPYGTTHSDGTGKGTIIITQNISSKFVDFNLKFKDGFSFPLQNA